MLERRAFLGLGAAFATTWSLGGAGATELRRVEMRIRVALPPTLGEARIRVVPLRASGMIVSADTSIESDADLVEHDGAGLVSGWWRPGAPAPRLMVITRLAIPENVENTALARPEPWAETPAGRVVWSEAPGPCYSLDFIDLSAPWGPQPLV